MPLSDLLLKLSAFCTKLKALKKKGFFPCQSNQIRVIILIKIAFYMQFYDVYRYLSEFHLLQLQHLSLKKRYKNLKKKTNNKTYFSFVDFNCSRILKGGK